MPQMSPARWFAIIFAAFEVFLLFLYTHNLIVFAHSEQLFTLLWLHVDLQGSFDGFLAQLPCSPDAEYLWCGLDQTLFLTGYLLIPLGGVIVYVLSRRLARLHHRTRMLSMTGAFVMVFTKLMIHGMTAGAALLIAGGVLIVQADRQIDQTVVMLQDDQSMVRDHVVIADAIEALPADQEIQVHEAVFAMAHAAVLPEKLNQDHDSFFRTVLIPLVIDLRADELITQIPDVVWLADEHRLLVFDAPLEVLQTLTPVVSTHLLRSSFSDAIDARPMQISIIEDLQYVVYQQQRIREIYDQYEAQLALFDEEVAVVEQYLRDNQALSDSIPPSAENSQEVLALIQQYSAEAEAYKNQLQRARAAVAQQYQRLQDSPVTPELQGGVYFFPDEIYVRYFNDEENLRAQTFSRYLYVILHEQLHLYSSGEELFDTYLEEGITDYLALSVLIEHFQYENVIRRSYAGYPDEIEVVRMLLERIDRDELLAAYFAQDLEAFEVLFVEAFPSVSYEQFRAEATTLTYLPLNADQQRRESLAQLRELLGLVY